MTREEFFRGKSALEIRNALLIPVRDPRSRFSQIKVAIESGKPVPKKVANEFIGLGELLAERKSNKLPKRTADTMSEAIALSSPSGKMSKAARKRADKRLSVSLFGEKGLQRPTTQQPDEQTVLKRQAVQLRELAARGLSPRKNRAAAAKLEARIRPSQRGFDRS